MKTRLLLLLSFLSISSLHLKAQTTELWAAVNWGNWGMFEGLIYKADGNGNCAQVVFAYQDDTLTGYGCQGGLLLASNGLVYGTVNQGGLYNSGVLFVIDPATNNYTKLWDFENASTGLYPGGNLTQAANGKLYGYTSNGGTFNKGVLYTYDIALDTCIALVHFDGTGNGTNPAGSIVEVSNGIFYGVTYSGGLSNKGTLFEYNDNTATIIKKHDFDGVTTGQNPGGIDQVSNGRIYGTTRSGKIFDYDLNTGIVTPLFQFTGTSNGTVPTGSLVEAPNGKLYGMCENGGDSTCSGGTVFEFDTATNTLTHVTNVCNPADTIFFNYDPQGILFLASNGKLYGSTDWTYFEYDMNTHVLEGKLDFNDAFGALEPRNMRFIEVPRNNSEYVWPGDCNSDLVADNLDILSIGLAYNDTGSARPCASIDWVASASDNWTDTLTGGINKHHADANGDGIVNADDTMAVFVNYGLVHVNRPAVPRTGPTDFFLVPDHTTLLAGDTVRFDIFLTGGTPVDSLYGIAFSLLFDSTLVEPVSYSLSYAGSSLGGNLLSFEKDGNSPGIIHAAVSRTDHMNATGLAAPLGTFSLIVSQSVTALNVPLVVMPFDITGVLAGGEDVSFTPITDTVFINAPSGLNTLTKKDCFLYPNPAGDQFTIRLLKENISELEILDMEGRVIFKSQPGSRELLMDVSGYRPGIYTVTVRTASGTAHTRLIVTHP